MLQTSPMVHLSVFNNFLPIFVWLFLLVGSNAVVYTFDKSKLKDRSNILLVQNPKSSRKVIVVIKLLVDFALLLSQELDFALLLSLLFRVIFFTYV